jgi:hypothetical protein
MPETRSKLRSNIVSCAKGFGTVSARGRGGIEPKSDIIRHREARSRILLVKRIAQTKRVSK